MSHLDEGVLHAMLDGEIESAELRAIEAHLAGCGTCGARLEEARRFKDESLTMITALDSELGTRSSALGTRSSALGTRRSALGTRPGGWKRLPVWGRGLAWAATIVAAVGLGWSLQVGRSAATATLQPAAEPAAAPAPAVVADAEPRQSAPPARLARPSANAPASARLDPTATMAAPQPVRNEVKDGKSELATSALGARRSALDTREMVAGDLAKKALMAPADGEYRESGRTLISAAKAIETLGGSIRLVDGLTPVRYELTGDVVRVVYETGTGLLILEQWRAGNVVSHRLIAPRGAPEDSVSAWTERVR